jgi:hypothetical protein
VAALLPAPTHPGLTVAAVGDIMMGTDYPENILPDDDGVGFLTSVTPILAAPDVTLGNLEGVLQDGGEPVKQCKDKRICFLFRTPTRYAQYLAQAGFDALSLANNHARDFDEQGREDGEGSESVGQDRRSRAAAGHARAGPEHLVRQHAPRAAGLGRARRAGQGGCARPHLEPDDLREGDRLVL